MKARFTISQKLAVGFGLIIVVVGLIFFITFKTLEQGRLNNEKINKIYAPSITALKELNNLITRSQDLIFQWVNIQRDPDWQERKELMRLMDVDIPEKLTDIKEYADAWPADEQQKKDTLESNIDSLLSVYRQVQSMLPNHESYVPENEMAAGYFFIEGGVIPVTHHHIEELLYYITIKQQKRMAAEIERVNLSFEKLSAMLINTAIGVLFGGILIGILTSRSIIRPVNSLKRKLVNLGQGIYSAHAVRAGNDEIGDMAVVVEKLISNLEKTKEFSTQVGAGNFNVPFVPLSDHDELGIALLRMRTDLASYRNEMESKVTAQTHEIREQKDEVEAQRERVTLLYNDLQASIRYAQRLQEAILPGDEYIKSLFPDSFVFYRPKATVSGDFYWFKRLGGKNIFAAADCTGHGVPGAFMSLVGHNVLNQVTKVYTRPSQILNSLNRLASEVIRNEKEGEHMRDGMDVSLCTLDPETLLLEFSGAHNPIYLVRDGELSQLESDPFSIGSFVHGEQAYTNHTVQLSKGDCIYMFSDGYSDQFGGPNGKKFMRKQFRMLLLNMHSLPMAEQKWKLAETLDRWQGEQEQVDDIMVIGLRI